MKNVRGAGRRLKMLSALTLTIVAMGVAAAVHTPGGPRTLTRFEPDRLAQLETDMWRAYYAKARLRLFALLVTTLREQYGYSWARAVQAGYHLARAAADFGDTRENYEEVLPDLEAAYAIAREWTTASFDPRLVACAELAWWVARRTPGRSDVAFYHCTGNRGPCGNTYVREDELSRLFGESVKLHLRSRKSLSYLH